MIQSSRYRLSFTFGGLLVSETRSIAVEYVYSRDWNQVRSRVMEDNLLQKTRSSSSFRYFREIRDRLSQAYPWEIELIAGGTATHTPSGRTVEAVEMDIPLIILAVVSRYYSLIGDFISEVLRTRIAEGLLTVDSSMFRSYLADLAPEHPELQKISTATRKKLTQVSLRVLKEAGIAVGSREPYALTVPGLSDPVKKLYCNKGNIGDYSHLLWSDKEIFACTT